VRRALVKIENHKFIGKVYGTNSIITARTGKSVATVKSLRGLGATSSGKMTGVLVQSTEGSTQEKKK